MKQRVLRSEKEIAKEVRELVAEHEAEFRGYEVGLHLAEGTRGITDIAVVLFEAEGTGGEKHTIDRIITAWGDTVANKVLVYWADLMKARDEDLDRLRALHKLSPNEDSIYKKVMREHLKIYPIA